MLFFFVSATVLPSCLVVATPLSFGTYIPTVDIFLANKYAHYNLGTPDTVFH